MQKTLAPRSRQRPSEYYWIRIKVCRLKTLPVHRRPYSHNLWAFLVLIYQRLIPLRILQLLLYIFGELLESSFTASQKIDIISKPQLHSGSPPMDTEVSNLNKVFCMIFSRNTSILNGIQYNGQAPIHFVLLHSKEISNISI